MRVLGIDPGYERVGIAVLEKADSRGRASREVLLFSSCFKTSPSLSFHERLLAIGKEIRSVIGHYSPDALAIEQLFFNSNQKTALLVSEARGVMLYEALHGGLRVFEYTPLQIKMAMVGYGRGSKDQVQAMVRRLIVLPTPSTSDDEFDAIAAGLTCLASQKAAMATSVTPTGRKRQGH